MMSLSRNGEGQDQEHWAQPRRNASQPASPKPDMDNSIVSRLEVTQPPPAN